MQGILNYTCGITKRVTPAWNAASITKIFNFCIPLFTANQFLKRVLSEFYAN